MDEYKVVKINKNNNLFSKEVVLQDKQGNATTLVGAFNGVIPVGTKFKVYKTAAQQSIIQLRVAESYKVKGKRFVNIERKPITQSAIREFWEELDFCDRLRLHSDIKQALRHRGIAPALNRNSNLQLFLSGSTLHSR